MSKMQRGRILLGLLAVARLTDNVAIAEVRVERLASGLNLPLYAASAPGDNSRLFVAEYLTGAIKIIDPVSGAVSPVPFLTVPIPAGAHAANLLGFDFDPDFATTGNLYAHVIGAPLDPYGDRTNNIVEFHVPAGTPNQADPASARTVLSYTQHVGHEGGWIGFGPHDDYLYVNTGDGSERFDDGPGATPGIGNAQDLNKLLGKVLRIDVHSDDFPADPNRNYAIPADNPFVGSGAGEVWNYGLRNPWRASFDRQTGDFYIADVGQYMREEVNVQPADQGGRNYGWRLREGTVATTDPYEPPHDVGGPPPAGAIDPIYDYSHGTGAFQGSSITGGYVYRGPVAELQGLYFFGDYISHRIWSIRFDGSSEVAFNGTNFTELVDRTAQFQPDAGTIDDIVSFGEDALGNLYIIDLDGEIFKVVPEPFLGDMNGDGVVNNFDIQPLELALTHPGLYQSLYPGATAYQLRGDINHDGSFNNFDLQPFERFLTGEYAPLPARVAVPEMAAVPEPGGLVLLLAGTLSLLVVARGATRRAISSCQRS